MVDDFDEDAGHPDVLFPHVLGEQVAAAGQQPEQVVVEAVSQDFWLVQEVGAEGLDEADRPEVGARQLSGHRNSHNVFLPFSPIPQKYLFVSQQIFQAAQIVPENKTGCRIPSKNRNDKPLGDLVLAGGTGSDSYFRPSFTVL